MARKTSIPLADRIHAADRRYRERAHAVRRAAMAREAMRGITSASGALGAGVRANIIRGTLPALLHGRAAFVIEQDPYAAALGIVARHRLKKMMVPR